MEDKNDEIVELNDFTNDSVLNLIIDTILKNKQILIFVNSKRNAESLAQKVALRHSFYEEKLNNEELIKISNEILNALETPTEQCKKLAEAVKYGVAFHHSGLVSKQRELIENNFRNGIVKVIVATPTLAAGVNLPAFRVLIKDLYRYEGYMKPISIAEFHQMAGRAGRPGYETYGEAIASGDPEFVFDHYIYSDPEPITSKLGVESTLRQNILALACRYNNVKSIMNFISKTFYAYQYQDLYELEKKVRKIIDLLAELDFIAFKSKSTSKSFLGFKPASEEMTFEPTGLGLRVNQLYLDPLSASKIIAFLNEGDLRIEKYLFTLASTSEILPLFSVSRNEYQDVFDFLLPLEIYPDNESARIGKLALILLKWINEVSEQELLETHNIRPGELRSKLQIITWLSYSAIELAKIIRPEKVDWLKEIDLRLQYGVKHELLNLVQIKHIGRKRARMLYINGITNLRDLIEKSTSARKLLGKHYDRIINELKRK